jgi:hypothetical protein
VDIAQPFRKKFRNDRFRGGLFPCSDGREEEGDDVTVLFAEKKSNGTFPKEYPKTLELLRDTAGRPQRSEHGRKISREQEVRRNAIDRYQRR